MPIQTIQLSYEDSTGKRIKASRESVAVVQKILDEHEPHKTQPVQVVWENCPVPAGTIELEEGGTWNRRDRLPFGYHTLDGDTLLIHAPRNAFAPDAKTWGMFLPLYAVPPNGGDLGDLEAYMDWVHELGGSVVATLPLLAAFDDEPSPYSPVSRLFWNERYLDVEALPEYRGNRDLKELAANFVSDEGFERFARNAREYAEFRASMSSRAKSRDLGGADRTPIAPPEPPGPSTDAPDDIRYHLYVQYRMSQQMEKLAARGLYLDFPLGVNGGGYDVQKYGHVFAKGFSVGSPPDSYFTKGQNWGFPPFHPEALRADRYRYFRAAIANHARHASILRLDHVMGLHRLFWIPDGMDAKDGVYVRYHDEELYAIIVLESVRNRCVIVGEDLGTVPEYVPKAMERRGLRRMHVVQYEGKVANPPTASVASINTHDMPTFAAYWNAMDVDDRLDMELLDERGAIVEREARAQVREQMQEKLGAGDDVLEQILRFLAESEAEVVLINLEDLWGETEPQNVPGMPEKSWKQRFRLSLQDAQKDPQVMRILSSVAEARALLSSPGGQ